MWFSDGICGRHLQIMVRTRGLGRSLGRLLAVEEEGMLIGLVEMVLETV